MFLYGWKEAEVLLFGRKDNENQAKTTKEQSKS